MFRELPPPLSCKALVQMELKIKLIEALLRRGLYPAPLDQINGTECQTQECIDAVPVEEYQHGDNPRGCRPGFPVVTPGSTARRLGVDYSEVDKETKN